MNQTELFIGVDVSKNYLDVAFGHLENAPVERFQNATEPVAQLVARLQQLQPTLIVLESTGGYERLLLTKPGCRLHRSRVRAFAKAEGLHGPAGRAAVGALWGAHAPGGG
jgi:transposase